jgi:hypothetical protein
VAERDPIPDFAELFSPFLDGSTRRTEADRTVAAMLDHAYRGGGDQRKVTLRRRVRCGCTDGCKECGQVGWTVKEETLTIVVPAGVALGSKLRLEEKGDEVAVGPLVIVGDLFVEVTEDGARAEELRAAQREHEAGLDASWTKASRAAAFARRKAMLNVSLLLGVPLALVVGMWSKEHFDKRRLGETCARPTDCRSGDCLGVCASASASSRPTRIASPTPTSSCAPSRARATTIAPTRCAAHTSSARPSCRHRVASKRTARARRGECLHLDLLVSGVATLRRGPRPEAAVRSERPRIRGRAATRFCPNRAWCTAAVCAKPSPRLGASTSHGRQLRCARSDSRRSAAPTSSR